MRRSRSLLLFMLVPAMVVAACTGDDDAADTTYGYAATTTMARDVDQGIPPAAGDDAVGGDGEEAASEGPGTNASAVVTSVDPADFGRLIVFSANVEVEVADVVAAGEQAKNAIAGLGGFLFGQETQTGESPRSVLTIKVLPDRFDEALARLGGLGELKSQTIYADDVTERVVDLQSQITTAEASVERLRGFLADAASLEDLASLEAELLRRETDLEILRGRLRTLEDQVALATIVLVLSEPTSPVPEPAAELVQTGYAGHDGGSGCPGNEQLTIDEGDELTLCYVVANTGDTALADVEVRDPGVGARAKDFVVVEGDVTAPLQPGGRLIFALETVADYPMWLGPEVTADAVDDSGTALRRPLTVEVLELELEVIEDTSLPGFVDSMREAGESLLRLWGYAVVVAGALVPYLWVPALLAGWWWWRRRRSTTTAEPAPPAPPEPEVDGGSQNAEQA